MELNPAADLWRNTLSQIPTRFGRLQYVASLRDPNTGIYQHFGLAQRFTEEAADETLRASHWQLFAEWLCVHLEEQKADLEEYLEGLGGNSKTILASWITLNSLRNSVPAQAREAEASLFFNDLEILLELLRSEYAVVLPDPDA